MAKKPKSRPQDMKARAAKTAQAMAQPSALAAEKSGMNTLAMIRNLPRFSREVRAEARKITWTSRKETWITSVMVAIMVVLAAGFFFVVDAGLSFAVTQILKLANAG
jgi:preprotein translocase subunit SecE